MSFSTKIILIIAAVTVVGGGLLLFRSGALDNGQGTSAPVDEKLLVTPGSHTAGPDEARVTIVEFADFECPACGAFHPVLKNVLAKFPQDVRLVYRHFPLTQHTHAIPASLASEAAARQGKFWEMHNALYEHQEDLTDQAIRGYAQAIGLSMDQFERDWAAIEIRQLINQDLSAGSDLGLRATPTWFINGMKHEGGYTEEDLTAEVDRLLGN
ncbi:MAG TPA: thioredoxin domain-containing protein [Patescibacteria group bacterium]|nr:thioredoxin domain-containing protein [Patescibacteria group bacterium]